MIYGTAGVELQSFALPGLDAATQPLLSLSYSC